MDYSQLIRIRDLRQDTDKTQTEIAVLLETSQTMYARYERFANELPLRHLVKLCQYYNVSVDYMLGLTNQKLPFPCRIKAPKIKYNFQSAPCHHSKQSFQKSSTPIQKSVPPNK